MISATKEYSQREFGIDILRVIAMLLIVMHHILSHGNLYESAIQSGGGIEYQSVSYICGFGINIFAMISGYVGIRIGTSCSSIISKGRISKFIKLWSQVLFYSLGIFVIIGLVYSFDNFLPSLIKVILPISSKQYWYFSAYVGVFLIAPGLNLVAKGIADSIKSDKRKILTFFAMIIIICLMWSDPFGFVDGYTFAWLAFLYIIGAVIEQVNFKEKLNVKVLICVLSLIVFLSVSLYAFSPFGINLLERTSPINIIPCCLLLIIFSKIKVDNKRIRNLLKVIAPSIFAVYLIHDNIYFRKYFISGKFSIESIHGVHPLIYLLVSALIILSLGIVIDQVRIRASKYINLKLSNASNKT